MHINRLNEIFTANAEKEAVIYKDSVFRYRDIERSVNEWSNALENNGISPDAVVSITGDYSPEAISLVIALIMNNNIIVPISPQFRARFEEFWKISETQFIINLSQTDSYTFVEHSGSKSPEHQILRNLQENAKPGLVLFTSGSTGEPKAVVHDLDKLLSKFAGARKSYRTLCFLMFDHIAGIDTYFYSLFSGGTAVFPTSRNPEDICRLIEKHRVDVLPTSPTFLNLLLISEEYKRHDLSSLQIITFGSERMPEALLERLRVIFKGKRLIQKYGVTELGSPPSRSKPSDPAWIKIDSETFKTRIIDGILYVKAETAMLGYLNAPSPFTEDGWFNTGDAVEADGEYIKILGRASEIINVGGEKVYPAEVENAIQEMHNVADVTVFSEKNPIVGNMVCANITLLDMEDPKTFTVRLKHHCRGKLEPFKIPVRVRIVDEFQHNSRFKKVRRHV